MALPPSLGGPGQVPAHLGLGFVIQQKEGVELDDI